MSEMRSDFHHRSTSSSRLTLTSADRKTSSHLTQTIYGVWKIHPLTPACYPQGAGSPSYPLEQTVRLRQHSCVRGHAIQVAGPGFAAIFFLFPSSSRWFSVFRALGNQSQCRLSEDVSCSVLYTFAIQRQSALPCRRATSRWWLVNIALAFQYFSRV